MTPDLDEATATYRRFLDDVEWEGWCRRMDDHFHRRMWELDAGFEANRSETIQRNIWGRRYDELRVR